MKGKKSFLIYRHLMSFIISKAIMYEFLFLQFYFFSGPEYFHQPKKVTSFLKNKNDNSTTIRSMVYWTTIPFKEVSETYFSQNTDPIAWRV